MNDRIAALDSRILSIREDKKQNRSSAIIDFILDKLEAMVDNQSDEPIDDRRIGTLGVDPTYEDVE